MSKKIIFITLLALNLPSYAQNEPPPSNNSAAEHANEIESELENELDSGTETNADELPKEPCLEQTDEQAPSTFSGEGELGYTTTSGNTDTESLNGKLGLSYQKNLWKHSGDYETQRATDSDTITVERSITNLQSDYNYNPKRYAFITARYEDDEFSGFAFQRSVTFGHGWHIADTEKTKFNLELGYGYRQSKTDLEEAIDEGVARLFAGFSHLITASTELTQEILVEAGEKNTHSESSSGLKISINGSLALKISYDIKHNSDPPPGIEKADKTTSITLVYGF